MIWSEHHTFINFGVRIVANFSLQIWSDCMSLPSFLNEGFAGVVHTHSHLLTYFIINS